MFSSLPHDDQADIFYQPNQTSQKHKVLIVDDELQILVSLKRALRSEFEIEAATSSEQALHMIETNDPYTAIISDMHMPHEDGISLLAKVKQLAPETVRILLTGDGSTATTIGAVNRGHVFRFLSKPCSLDLMRSTLEDAVIEFNRSVGFNRKTSELLGLFQHEFRTPLHQIIGFSSLLAEEAVSPEDLKDYALHIHQCGQNILQMTNQQLILQQIGDGSYSPHKQWVSVKDLIEPVIAQHALHAMQMDVELVCNIDDESQKLYIDKDLMVMALDCLISNAIKFNCSGGRVHVHYQTAKGLNSFQSIEVTDTGIGFGDVDIEALKQPLIQADMSRTRLKGGLGMGLPLVSSISNFNEGHLELANRAEGGASAKIIIPDIFFDAYPEVRSD